MNFEIIQVGPVFWDNYIYILNHTKSNDSFVIDPPPVADIDSYLTKENRNLIGILNTHHHQDHAGGIESLKNKYLCPVYGPTTSPLKPGLIDHFLTNGSRFEIFGETASIKFLEGHLSPLLALWFPQHPSLFCSDLLFSLGCGRNYEGGIDALWKSLSWIASLAKDTLLYCSHEYTEKNGQFALSVEPSNRDLVIRMNEVIQLRSKGLSTVPSTVEMEIATNPFLRPYSKEIRSNLGLAQNGVTDVEVIRKLRKIKDQF